MTYIIQITPLQITLSTSTLFDLEMPGELNFIHTDLHDDAWLCASLPSYFGGFGGTLAATVSSLPYYSSMLYIFPSPARPYMPPLRLPNVCHFSFHDHFFWYGTSAVNCIPEVSPHNIPLLHFRTRVTSQIFARNLTCRTMSSHLPLTELPEPRSCTRVEPDVGVMVD